MSSLYQIYLDGLKRLRGIETPDDPSGMSSDLATPNTDQRGVVQSPEFRDRRSPLMDNPIFNPNVVPPGQGRINIGDTSVKIPGINPVNNNVPKTDQMPSDPIVTGGMGTQFANDTNFLTKLSNLAGIDFGKAAEQWKDKGGFEGLMANPAFTMGLAFMQAGAEGKTLGQGALDNVIKAAGISQQYKKLIESRAGILEVTASDVADMKAELENYGFAGPNAVEQFFGRAFSLGKKNPQKAFDKAAELFALEYKKEVRKRAKAAGKTGADFVVDSSLRKEIIEKIIREKKAKVKDNLIPFLKGTIEAPEETYTIQGKADGGPVEAGKPYVVGEEGPEIIIPKSDGNVLTNDDSQIYAMLLAANPQLQQVSRQRAEKILRARFPEYFEG